MSLKVFTKLFVLLSALTFTVVAIFWLKQGHMNAFWTSLGFQTGTRLNWCEERVASLHFYDTPLVLVEKSGQWMWDGESPQTLDYLRVEKWFARYCQIPVDNENVVEGPVDRPLVEVRFINDERISIYTNGEDGFRVQDQVFTSETLRQGLKELMAFGENIGYQ